MLDESGFGAATEMGGFALDKGPEVSLEPEPFWTSILTSSGSVRAAAKQSISNNFFPFWFPEQKVTNTTATPATISSYPVSCLFECLGPIPTREGGGVEQMRKRL